VTVSSAQVRNEMSAPVSTSVSNSAPAVVDAVSSASSSSSSSSSSVSHAAESESAAAESKPKRVRYQHADDGDDDFDDMSGSEYALLDRQNAIGTLSEGSMSPDEGDNRPHVLNRRRHRIHRAESAASQSVCNANSSGDLQSAEGSPASSNVFALSEAAQSAAGASSSAHESSSLPTSSVHDSCSSSDEHASKRIKLDTHHGQVNQQPEVASAAPGPRSSAVVDLISDDEESEIGVREQKTRDYELAIMMSAYEASSGGSWSAAAQTSILHSVPLPATCKAPLPKASSSSIPSCNDALSAAAHSSQSLSSLSTPSAAASSPTLLSADSTIPTSSSAAACAQHTDTENEMKGKLAYERRLREESERKNQHLSHEKEILEGTIKEEREEKEKRQKQRIEERKSLENQLAKERNERQLMEQNHIKDREKERKTKQELKSRLASERQKLQDQLMKEQSEKERLEERHREEIKILVSRCHFTCVLCHDRSISVLQKCCNTLKSCGPFAEELIQNKLPCPGCNMTLTAENILNGIKQLSCDQD